MEVVIAAGDANCASVAVLYPFENTGEDVATCRVADMKLYDDIFLHRRNCCLSNRFKLMVVIIGLNELLRK